MAEDKQIELRDALCMMMMEHVERGETNLIGAATAALGACAVALGAMPRVAREAAADTLSASLLEHANRRAAEIRAGTFDDRPGRSRRGR